MQVKEIDIDTGKIKKYGICNNKKVSNLIFRWSYHSDLLYNLKLNILIYSGVSGTNLAALPPWVRRKHSSKCCHIAI